jgi:hypothetical protein
MKFQIRRTICPPYLWADLQPLAHLLAQVSSVYTWDAANHLVSANVNGVASSFEYDGLPGAVVAAWGLHRHVV